MCQIWGAQSQDFAHSRAGLEEDAVGVCGGDLGDSGWGIPDWTCSKDMSKGDFTGGWDKGLEAGLGDVCREGKVGEEEGLGVQCRVKLMLCL